MNKFSIENFKDSSSTKENAGKMQLFLFLKKPIIQQYLNQIPLIHTIQMVIVNA